MRWTQNDSRAFADVTKAGEGLRAAYERSQAGQAYQDATQQTNQADELNGYARASANAQGDADAQEFGLSPGERAMYAPQAATAPNRYGLGQNPTQWQDTPYTPQQRRMAGLQALEAYHAGKGNVEEQLKYGMAADTAQANAITQEKGGLELNELRAHNKILTDLRTTTAAMSDPTHPQYGKTWEKFVDMHTKDPNIGGNSYSKFIPGEDGKPGQVVIYPPDYDPSNPNGQSPQVLSTADPRLQTAALDEYTNKALARLNPAEAMKLRLSDKHNTMLMNRYDASDKTARRGQDLTYDARMTSLETRAAMAPYLHPQSVGITYTDAEKSVISGLMDKMQNSDDPKVQASAARKLDGLQATAAMRAGLQYKFNSSLENPKTAAEWQKVGDTQVRALSPYADEILGADGRKVQPTPAGQALAAQAKQAGVQFNVSPAGVPGFSKDGKTWYSSVGEAAGVGRTTTSGGGAQPDTPDPLANVETVAQRWSRERAAAQQVALPGLMEQERERVRARLGR